MASKSPWLPLFEFHVGFSFDSSHLGVLHQELLGRSVDDSRNKLYKQMLMGGGLERVYEVGPAFRAEEHNTPRHLNEFISIDINR